MNYLNFTDRDSYLKLVAEWREEYKEVSAGAISAKRNFVEAQRTYSKFREANSHHGYATWNWPSEVKKELWSLETKVNQARDERSIIRYKANQLLIARTEMKEKAHEQVMAQKAARGQLENQS
jgi:hypothetical protein